MKRQKKRRKRKRRTSFHRDTTSTYSFNKLINSNSLKLQNKSKKEKEKVISLQIITLLVVKTTTFTKRMIKNKIKNVNQNIKHTIITTLSLISVFQVYLCFMLNLPHSITLNIISACLRLTLLLVFFKKKKPDFSFTDSCNVITLVSVTSVFFFFVYHLTKRHLTLTIWKMSYTFDCSQIKSDYQTLLVSIIG